MALFWTSTVASSEVSGGLWVTDDASSPPAGRCLSVKRPAAVGRTLRDNTTGFSEDTAAVRCWPDQEPALTIDRSLRDSARVSFDAADVLCFRNIGPDIGGSIASRAS